MDRNIWLRYGMKNEIEYAVQEAFSMNLSTEQAIKFIMRVAPCSRESASKALQAYTKRVVMAH